MNNYNESGLVAIATKKISANLLDSRNIQSMKEEELMDELNVSSDVLSRNMKVISFFQKADQKSLESLVGQGEVAKVFVSEFGEILYHSNRFLVSSMEGEMLDFSTCELDVIEVKKLPFSSNYYRVELEESEGIGSVLTKLRLVEGIESVDPDFKTIGRRRFDPEENNGGYKKQWHLNNRGVQDYGNAYGRQGKMWSVSDFPMKAKEDIRAESAWNLLKKDSNQIPQIRENVSLAIIDGGFDLTNEDLANYDKQLAAFSSGGGLLNTNDFSSHEEFQENCPIESHGTVIASLAAGRLYKQGDDDDLKAKSVVGVAFGAVWFPVALDALFSDIDFAEAIAYSANPGLYRDDKGAEDGAAVISLSISPRLVDRMNPVIKEAIDYATSIGRAGKGSLICWAVPNEVVSVNEDAYNAYERVLAVGRSNNWGRYGGSARGVELDVLAPGESVYSAGYKGELEEEDLDYFYGSGTSYATPIVSGIAILMLSANDELTWLDLHRILRETAVKIDLNFLSFVRNNGRWEDVLGNPILGDDGMFNFKMSGDNVISSALSESISVENDRETVKLGGDITGFEIGSALLIGYHGYLTADVNHENSSTNKKLNLNSVEGLSADQKLIIKGPRGVINYIRKTGGKNTVYIHPIADFGLLGPKTKFKVVKMVPAEDPAEDPTELVLTFTYEGMDQGRERILLGGSDTDFESLVPGDIVQLEDSEEVTIESVDATTDSVTLKKALKKSFSYSDRVTLVDSELTYIKSMDGSTLTVYPLNYDHDEGAAVFLGYKPHFSIHHGYGRVDASEAVSRALNYSPQFNFLIKDTESDDGQADVPEADVDSPDIWVTNVVKIGGTQPSDHRSPMIDKDRYIHVKIRNTGSEANTEAWLRVYALFDVPRSDVSEAWRDYFSFEAMEVFEKEGRGVLFIGEKKILEGEVEGGQDVIKSIKWNKSKISDRWDAKVYLLAHVTPEEDVITLETDEDIPEEDKNVPWKVHERSNQSFREVKMIENIGVYEFNGLRRLTNVNLDELTTEDVHFFIRIEDASQVIDVENTSFVFQRKSKEKGKEEVVIAYDNGEWKSSVDQNWITIEAPTDSIGGDTLATGLVSKAFFHGSMRVEEGMKKVKIDVSVKGASQEILHDKRVVVKFKEIPRINFSQKSLVPFHFFTNIDKLKVQETKAFGPAVAEGSEEQGKDIFRLDSWHSATGNVKAYAMCDGLVCAQRTASGYLNIILKPIVQPSQNLNEIKYIIYRGIKADSLIDNKLIANPSKNRLTESIWAIQEAHNDDARKKASKLGVNHTDQKASENALGLHLLKSLNDRYDDDAPIENLFTHTEKNYQYVLVRGGWDIGEFNEAEFGIEIVLNHRYFQPTIGDVREKEHKITLPPFSTLSTESDKWLNRWKREEVLAYMDPCALIGTFFREKFFYLEASESLTGHSDFEKAKKQEIYDLLMSKFINKNRVYLSIVNELGTSYDFMGNYSSELNVQMPGISVPGVTSYRDEEQGWPIKIWDPEDFKEGLKKRQLPLDIFLPVSDESMLILENELPLVYITEGSTKGLLNIKEYEGREKFKELQASFIGTEEKEPTSKYSLDAVNLAVAGNPDSSTTEVIGTTINLNYLKREKTVVRELEDGAPQDNKKVFRSNHFLDYVFAPLDLMNQIPKNYSGKNYYQILQRNTYLNAVGVTDLQMDYMGNVGVGVDEKNITFFVTASLVRNKLESKKSKSHNLVGKAGQKEDMIREVLVDGLILSKRELTINDEIVECLELGNTWKSDFKTPDAKEFSAITIQRSEWSKMEALIKDQTKFDSENFPVFMAFKANGEEAHKTDQNGNSYSEYEIVLRGYKLENNDYKINEIGTEIIIYSYGTV